MFYEFNFFWIGCTKAMKEKTKNRYFYPFKNLYNDQDFEYLDPQYY